MVGSPPIQISPQLRSHRSSRPAQISPSPVLSTAPLFISLNPNFKPFSHGFSSSSIVAVFSFCFPCRPFLRVRLGRGCLRRWKTPQLLPQLAELFENAGNVEMVEVIYDKMTGRSRGFGFVTMSSAEEVEAAAQQFNGCELDGRPLRVNSGPPPPRDENSRFRSPPRAGGGGGSSDNENRVHVGNLAWGVDNMALESLFRASGRVLEAKVIYDRESRRSRGFGFVTFSSPEEVNRAIRSLDGVESMQIPRLCKVDFL